MNQHLAAVCGPVIKAAVSGLGPGAGLLGRAYDPFAMYDDPTKPLRTEALALPPDLTLGQMRARYDLRTALTSRQRLGPGDFENYYSKDVLGPRVN